MFVGRKKEAAYLEELYKKDRTDILCMYGHKGVGKTSLMLSFAQNKSFYYYEARPVSDELSLQIFFDELNNGQNTDALNFGEDSSASDYYRAILNNVQYLPSANGNNKRVLIIDEFQYLIKNDDLFIKELIDYTERIDENILVVLISSSISFVENSLVPKIGQLARRFSGFYKVSPLSFVDCVSYFSNYDTENCMKVYSLLGGIPSYWARFSDKITVDENIKRCLLHPDAPLRHEGFRIVSDELREINVYSTILYYLANGNNKLNELHVKTGFSRAKISVYIKNMMERELVEKVFSFDDASTINAKKGVYRIRNPYLHFYYKFIFAKESRLVLSGPSKYFEEFVKNELDDFYEEHFRIVCTEFLTLLSSMGKLPIRAQKTGEWVGKRGSIDVVMRDDDDNCIVAYCSWKKDIITVKDYKLYLSIAQDARIHPDYIIILAKGEFDKALHDLTKEVDNIMLIQASSL